MTKYPGFDALHIQKPKDYQYQDYLKEKDINPVLIQYQARYGEELGKELYERSLEDVMKPDAAHSVG